jgi:hypothetical protein
MVVVQAQADLLEVVGALHPVGGRPHFLHRRQQQGDQDTDNGNDDEELDEGEAQAPVPRHGASVMGVLVPETP